MTTPSLARVAARAVVAAAHADGRAFARATLRWPLEYAVRWLVATTPRLAPAALGDAPSAPPPLPPRRPWNIQPEEERLLAQLVHATGVKRVFELGTFDGRTTLLLAQVLAESAGGQVVTLDLPDAAFAAHGGAAGGITVGECFRGQPAAARITQLRGDAATFDFCPWRGTMDLVFVDAAHDYASVLRDSRTALSLVRPGGTVVWHDYGAQWLGCTLAIREATRGHGLRLLEGTSLALVHVEEEQAHG